MLHLHLREMCEFLRWGDQVSLQAARSVSEAEYLKDQHISVGSLHKLLVHCMAVQWLWLCRFRGESPTKLEDEKDYPNRMALEQRWPLVHSALIDFVGRQSQTALQHNVSYQDTRGETHTLPLRDMILHLIDHGSYHRGQINTMIKRAGGTPIPVSFRQWAAERQRLR
ncbi:MAG: DinB family protein [Tepidisphaeraceae bacterium]